MISNKIFLIILFSLIYIPSLFVLFMCFLFIINIKQNSDLESSVKYQINNNSIYNKANMNTFQYKLELLRIIKPKVLALGSSRVMQFREESFNTTFITAGGAMNHLNEGLLFLKKMIKFHKPELIIIGLDFWWFNQNFNQPEKFKHEYEEKFKLVDEIHNVLAKFKNNSLNFETLMYGLKKENNLTNYENIGLNSIKYSNGFRKDGSYQYSSFILGDEKNSDINFSNTFNRIENGNSRFEYGNNLSEERVKIFKDIIKFTQENNIKLILVIPPLANEVIQKMDNFRDKYNFVNEFRKLIKNSNIEYYDFHDMRDYYKNSCEFVDGFHGGDVTYQRILKKMYDENSILSKYLNIESIKKSIDENVGKTLTIFDKNKYKKHKEHDYLELGCIK
ncbi:hypothetical protein CJ671_05455 [Aliarcobacter cryaerophilus]|uniref:Uncharacterized protein n=1 Tax=Aliarcobacter cryaerophilus TaxID=28198 RepID=A0A2S9ST96_9BACT|nr:hypothetical protein [Aliarcobacter cryaerophilus]PRM89808.1 hypothetical protein CJ671_05455 [Aliarcobacter cryaerophilus]